MEELSSAESGGRFGLPPTTPASALRRAESATAGTATGPATGPATTSPFAATAAAAHRPSSLSGSLRDIQQLMDEQVGSLNERFEKERGYLGTGETGGMSRFSAPLAEEAG